AEREDPPRRALFAELGAHRGLLVEERERPRRVAALERSMRLAEALRLGDERIRLRARRGRLVALHTSTRRGGLAGRRRDGRQGRRRRRRSWRRRTLRDGGR